MKIKTLLLGSFLLSFSSFAADSIEGKWKTIDDKINKPKSIVEIKKQGNQYIGTIIELLPDAVTDVCNGCKGEDKNRPLVGMNVLSGFKKISTDNYEDGKVFDPESGRTYSGAATVTNNNTLTLRGYVGIKLLGRSQTWIRVE